MENLAIKYNIPQEIVNIWINQESNELLDIQKKAIEEYNLLNGNNLLITAPSSSGKTFVAEIASINAWLNHKKVIFLVPMKAIAEEKYGEFLTKYKDLGLKVVISTHDRVENDENILTGHFDIAIIIFEKMNSLLTQNTALLNSCGLVVIDELQIINDPGRGSTLEVLLTKIKMIKEKDPGLFQFVGLSAVLGDIRNMDKWLGAAHLSITSRPIELNEGIHTTDGKIKFKKFNKGEVIEEYTGAGVINKSLTFTQPNSAEEEELICDRLVSICHFYLKKNKRILIFRKWKTKVRETAILLGKRLGLKSATSVITELNDVENSNSRETLIECLANGVAFHNADLSIYERIAIETEFRKLDSGIKVICSTSTLAMGVNLPSSVVIIADVMKLDPNAESFHEIPISASEYKNMSGRAGRTKYKEEGISIILANNNAEAIKHWRYYVNGKLDHVKAPLLDNDLRKVILDLFGSGLCKTLNDVKSFLNSSYTGYTHWNKNEKTNKIFLITVEEVCNILVKTKLLKFSENGYKATELGKLCAISGVEVETFILLKEAIEKIDPKDWHVWEVLFPTLLCKELKNIVKNYIKAYNFMELYSRIDNMNPKNRSQLAKWSLSILGDTNEHNKREAAFLILYDWIEGIEMDTIENSQFKHSRNKFLSGPIRNLAENTAWMIQTMYKISKLLNYSTDFCNELKILSERVSRGLPEEAIEIHKEGIKGLNRSTAMRLAKNGFNTLEKIVNTPANSFKGIINPLLATKIKDEIILRAKTSMDYFRLKHFSRLEKIGMGTDLIKPLYEKEGIELENAIVDLLNGPKLELGAQRISNQKKGEADIRIPIGKNLAIASVTASATNISDKKSAEIIKSGARYNPSAFIVFGRPDFHELAIENSIQISNQLEKNKNYKLIKISDLIEMYVLLIENKIEKKEFIEILLNSQGYLDIKDIIIKA